jgi:hypothetical protein
MTLGPDGQDYTSPLAGIAVLGVSSKVCRSESACCCLCLCFQKAMTDHGIFCPKLPVLTLDAIGWDSRTTTRIKVSGDVDAAFSFYTLLNARAR